MVGEDRGERVWGGRGCERRVRGWSIVVEEGGVRVGNAERSFWMSAIFVTFRKLFLAWELGKLVGEFRAHVMREMRGWGATEKCRGFGLGMSRIGKNVLEWDGRGSAERGVGAC